MIIRMQVSNVNNYLQIISSDAKSPHFCKIWFVHKRKPVTERIVMIMTMRISICLLPCLYKHLCVIHLRNNPIMSSSWAHSNQVLKNSIKFSYLWKKKNIYLVSSSNKIILFTLTLNQWSTQILRIPNLLLCILAPAYWNSLVKYI